MVEGGAAASAIQPGSVLPPLNWSWPPTTKEASTLPAGQRLMPTVSYSMREALPNMRVMR